VGASVDGSKNKPEPIMLPMINVVAIHIPRPALVAIDSASTSGGEFVDFLCDHP